MLDNLKRQFQTTAASVDEVKRKLNDEKYKNILIASQVSPITEKSEIEHSNNQLEVDILYRGISIGFLLVLTEAFNLKDYTTRDVVKKFITPVTANPSLHGHEPCRFAELACFSQYFGKADTFVSHCWRGKWGDLVAAVSNGYPLTRKVWIDIFAVTQHPQLDALQDDLGALEYVIENMRQGTTLVWNPHIQMDNMSNPVLRAWCLFEIHTTVIKDNALVLKMGKQGDNLSPHGIVDFVPVNDEDLVIKLVFDTDIRNAKASKPEDLDRIHSMIQKQTGFDELNTIVRTAVYNNWRILQIPAVQHALSGSKDEVIAVIKRYDADTYEGDPGGSLLHDCVHGNFCHAAELAIECGIDINKQTNKGNTPLMFAAEGGRLRMCKLLIVNGAELDLQNERKETALHLAAKYGRVDVVDLLVKEGADKTITDNGNYTASGLARLDKMPGCKDSLKILDDNESVLSSLSSWWCCIIK